MTAAEPFLRWAGGKRQLLPVLLDALPADFDLGRNRYFEPFVGGGALALALGRHASAPTAAPRTKSGRPLVLNDVNGDLVSTYRVVRDQVEDLIDELTRLQRDTSKERYYEIRAQRPAGDLERAARFVFLNKLSFNGLWRVNSKGEHNVPYGNIARPVVCDAELLRACSRWLAQAELRNGPYAAAVTDARAGDLVYLDPPYIPLSPTASFSKYAKDDFREMDQWALAGVVRGLVHRGVRVMLSNSNTELTRSVFGTDLTLWAVSATRSIGASASTRTRVEEVLGLSYPSGSCQNPAAVGALDPADPSARGRRPPSA